MEATMRIRDVANLAVFVATLLCVASCHEDPLAKMTLPPRHDLSARDPNVMSLSPSTTDLLMALGLAPTGRCAADTEPNLAPIPVVCNVKPDYEKIASLNPDVILYDPDLFVKADIDKFLPMKQVNIVAVGGHTVQQFIESVYAVGRCTSTESNAELYVDHIERDEDVAKSNPITPMPTAAMVLVNPSGNPMVAGTNSFFADVMRVSGAKPVGPDGSKFETMSVEALVALNPTILVVPVAADKLTDPHFNPLAGDPRLAALDAAKKGHVFAINEVVAERPGGRVDMAIRELHAGFVQVLAR
jgi:iron complex transport system substrate-binding protein